MSDPCAAMQVAIRAALKADAGVAAAFGANVVKVYDVPPAKAPTTKDKGPAPYIVIGDDGVVPIDAERKSLADLSCTVNVWSLTDPPSMLAAKTIGAAVLSCLMSLTGADGFSARTAHHERSTYLTDPVDNATTHGVIVVRYACEPLSS